MHETKYNFIFIYNPGTGHENASQTLRIGRDLTVAGVSQFAQDGGPGAADIGVPRTQGLRKAWSEGGSQGSVPVQDIRQSKFTLLSALCCVQSLKD